MTEQNFQPSELVNIRIDNAQFVVVDGRHRQFTAGTPGDQFALYLARGVPATFERVAPKEWPPRPGDIWQDREGDEWHAMGDGANPGYVGLWNMQDGSQFELHTVIGNWGPLTLVRRRGWTPDQPADEPQPDRRAEQIAGLRAFADMLAERHDLPLPGGINGQVGFRGAEGLKEAQRLAASFGVEMGELRDTGTAEQRWARAAKVYFGDWVWLTLYVYDLDAPTEAEGAGS